MDESPSVGDVLVSAFEREGCQASVARDRASALQLCRALRPDLITVEVGQKLDAHFIAQLLSDTDSAFIVITPNSRGLPPDLTDRAVKVFEKPFYLSEVVATTLQALGRPAHP